MFTGITSLDLVECLSNVPPVELKGLELLRQLRPFPGMTPPQLPLEALIEATTELVDYTKHCAQIAARLRALSPILLNTVPCAEFCL
jgi:hypothetical protein